jgi:hypothetical protein
MMASAESVIKHEDLNYKSQINSGMCLKTFLLLAANASYSVG